MLVLAVTAVLVAGAPEAPKPPSPPAATPTTQVERARAAVGKLKGALVGALTKSIEAGGPASAIGVCGDIVPRVRGEVSTADLKIGRTSSKLRNPTNTAPTWVAPHLADLEAAAADKRGPREVKLPDGGLGYVEPLVTAPLCLACHGPTLAPDVKAAIAAKYPQDKAVGFKEGDLRGVVWVEITGAAPVKP